MSDSHSAHCPYCRTQTIAVEKFINYCASCGAGFSPEAGRGVSHAAWQQLQKECAEERGRADRLQDALDDVRRIVEAA